MALEGLTAHYIFELQFKGLGLVDDGAHRPEGKHLLHRSLDEESMSDFSKFKEDLSKYIPEPFRLQYIDDDKDIISVDSEDEFKEFAKFAKHRVSRSMITKLILNANMQQYSSDIDNGPTSAEGMVKNVANIADLMQNVKLLEEVKAQIKKELKEEMSSQVVGAQENCEELFIIGYDQDSEGNLVPISATRRKLPTHQQKKLGNKEMKLDIRTEKVALKKKKAYEKFISSSSSKLAGCKTTMDNLWKYGMAHIMSGIAVKDTCALAKKVAIGKSVPHFWHIINDGTVNWQQVELRHTWSTPGFTPDEMKIPCPPLVVGEVGEVFITFRVPMTVGGFISYWHLYYLSDNQWLQFGHYISISGHTKLPKPTPEATGAIPKLKESSKEPKKTNVFNAEGGPTKKVQDIEEYKILNKECSMMCAQKMEANQKRLEATLASAEIAAEMARVAANAALRAALGKQNNTSSGASSPSPSASVNVNSTVGVGALNLPSPVNIPLPAVDDNISSPDENKKDADMAPKLIVLDDDSAIDININEEDSEDSEFVLVGMSGSEATNRPMLHVSIPGKTDDEMVAALEGNECIETMGQQSNSVEAVEDKPTDKAFTDQNVQGNVINVDAQMFDQCAPALPEKDMHEVKGSQAPLSYPRVDPNINYPVYPPHMSRPYTQYPSVYPVFPAPNAQAVPVPILKPEFNSFFSCLPPVHYPQLPTYPPMPVPSHPPQLGNPLVQRINMESFKTAQDYGNRNTELCPRPMRMNNQSAVKTNPELLFSPVKPSEMTQDAKNSAMANDPKVLAYNFNPIEITPDANKQQHATLREDKSDTTIKPVTLVAMRQCINAKQQDSSTPPKNNSTQTGSWFVVNQPEKDIVSVPGMQKKGESGIQILPQTLVDGAINVGATIYNTACNALNHLHLKDGESIEFDPVFENNMATLIEMGFSNLERNARLLKRCNNDINQVIGIICTTPGGNCLEID